MVQGLGIRINKYLIIQDSEYSKFIGGGFSILVDLRHIEIEEKTSKFQFGIWVSKFLLPNSNLEFGCPNFGLQIPNWNLGAKILTPKFQI